MNMSQATSISMWTNAGNCSESQDVWGFNVYLKADALASTAPQRLVVDYGLRMCEERKMTSLVARM